ncbi:MAG: Lrp/AsnC family transcriptional regulator [Granulosicoccus sp.]|nr:Lrp/AsnC family transcriptional regulator [Granulosicoccus sp.]
MSDLDKFDLKILDLLQSRSRIKSDAIADEVGLSATAVQRRIKRLRQSGVFHSETTTLDPNALGGRITVIVGVVLEEGSTENMNVFKHESRQFSEVQQCYWVTGEFDFIVIFSVKQIADYESLARKLFVENPGVKRFDSSITLETVKVGLQISL